MALKLSPENDFHPERPHVFCCDLWERPFRPGSAGPAMSSLEGELSSSASHPSAAPLYSDRLARTPRAQVIGVPGVRHAEPSRSDVICPGYAGHTPGEIFRFGRSASFQRPEAGSERHEITPAMEQQGQRLVRLARPTTAWEEIGTAARRQLSKSHSASTLVDSKAEWSPRGTTPFKETVGGVLSGYQGYLPGAKEHFGSPATGIRSSVGQHEAFQRSRAPRAQRDREGRLPAREKATLQPQTAHITAKANVGYQGHVPSRRETTGHSPWPGRGPESCQGKDLGWRPDSTPRSYQRSKQVTRVEGQATRAVGAMLREARGTAMTFGQDSGGTYSSPSSDRSTGLEALSPGRHGSQSPRRASPRHETGRRGWQPNSDKSSPRAFARARQREYAMHAVNSRHSPQASPDQWRGPRGDTHGVDALAEPRWPRGGKWKGHTTPDTLNGQPTTWPYRPFGGHMVLNDQALLA